MNKQFNTLHNNLTALKMIWNISKEQILFHYGVNFMQVILDFINGIYFLRTVIAIIEGGHTYNEYIIFISAILLLNTLRGLINAFYYFNRADLLKSRLTFGLNNIIFDKVTKIELECYENKNFYDNYHWAISNVENTILQILNNSASFASYVFLCLVILTYVVSIDPIVLVFAICPIIMSIFANINYKLNFNKSMALTSYLREKDYVKRVIFQKDFAHEMRLTNMYSILEYKLNTSIKHTITIYKKYGIKLALVQLFSQLSSSHLAFMGAIFYALYRLIILKNMSIADFSILVTAITTFNIRISNIILCITKAQEHSAFMKKLIAFLNYEPSMKDNNQTPSNFSHMNLNHVNFSYTSKENLLLKNINLEISKGEKIAIVGYNGAGKSTLVKLILRLYDVSDGEILYNEKNIKDYSIQQYRDRYGVMFQDNHIFSLNIGQNILLDNYEEIDTKRIYDAITNAGLSDLIQNETALNTNLTKEYDETGLVLSGGQEQKVFLARLYAQDFDLAILDEPSSALDPIAEHNIYQKVLDVTKDKTVLFVSHRLSSAILADKIVVLNNGEIEEVGTHEELMKTNGTYAIMFHAQAKNYIAGGKKHEK